MPHLPLMCWDCQDQLQASARQLIKDGGIPETTYYVYDAGGQRLRKVTESAMTSGDVNAGINPVRLKERLYLGGFEMYREYSAQDGSRTFERESLHIMDDQQRVALVETRTIDTAGKEKNPPQLSRYQFGNHLGLACLELNDQAQIISYEEVLPLWQHVLSKRRKGCGGA